MEDDKLAVIEVLEKLGALGSADHIALFLEEEGIKGHLTNSESCPITNYIERETTADASTGRFSVVLGLRRGLGPTERIDFTTTEGIIDFTTEDGDTYYLPQYEAISHFVAAFDHEKYPNLIEREE